MLLRDACSRILSPWSLFSLPGFHAPLGHLGRGGTMALGSTRRVLPDGHVVWAIETCEASAWGQWAIIHCNFSGSVLDTWSDFLEQSRRSIFPSDIKKSYFEYRIHKI